MASIHDSHLGVAEEVTYGTAVAPARYFEMIDESLAGDYQRINSEAFRAGQRVLHKDRFAPNPKGAAGTLNLEVLDGGFGVLFKHMLGAISTGTPDTLTVHTATVGDLKGKALTVQVARVDTSGTKTAFTYEGGKIGSWELSNGVDGVLKLALEMDFQAETIGSGGGGAYALATPSYPAGSQLFTFVTGTVQIAGSPFGVSEITVKGDNKLKTDRWSTVGKREPLEEGNREYTVELKGEFESVTHANRVASATAAGALAALSLEWSTPQGGLLTVTIPDLRFDEGPANFDGAKLIEQGLKGMALWDGSTSPITIEYTSIDEAP